MKDLTITPDTSIREAMKTLNKTAEKCLLVVGEERKLLGTLTDGDLRRSILNGADFTSSIKASYFHEPTVLFEEQYTKEEAGRLMRERKLDLLPVLNDKRKVVGYLTWEQVFGNGKKKEKRELRAPVVIMAGGKGTRLEPFTKVLPKPLVPIHEKPVIEHIIERFTSFGVNEFHITVSYKSHILKAFFEELKPDYSVSFVEEQEPLGTAGSLKFLENKLNQPFLVTNCDIILDADYADLYAFHEKNGYDMTLVASMKNYIIPYGTCELNSDGQLERIREKPEYNFLVNTGLYVLYPDVLKLIPDNKLYHITNLIEDARKEGLRVGVYPIGEDAWVDVGQWSEYKKVLSILEQ